MKDIYIVKFQSDDDYGEVDKYEEFENEENALEYINELEAGTFIMLIIGKCYFAESFKSSLSLTR